VTALDDVSFDIRAGEIHAVVEENGAGKSTLMKLLAGVHEADGGEIRIETITVRLKNPGEARRHGVSIVFQELSLFPHRTVAANVQVRSTTDQYIRQLGLVSDHHDQKVTLLSGGNQQ